jgi:hypothetical protein
MFEFTCMVMTEVEYEIVVAQPTGCDDVQLFHGSNIRPRLYDQDPFTKLGVGRWHFLRMLKAIR